MMTEAAEHVVTELPISAEAFGLVAFVALMTLLFIAYSFRNLSARH